MHTKFKLLLLAIALITLAARTALPVMAQNPTGSIRGIVTDQHGAVIQNATVTVTNKATGDTRKINAGSDGIYAVENLLPGSYDVKVEAQGFATQNITSLVVQTGSTSTGDATLRAGAVGEVVDVVAEAPIIDKQNFKIDGVVTRQKIDALPLNGRNFLQLALLEPGVGVSVSAPGNANSLFNVSIGGADSALTRITVDGGSVLDPVTGGAAQNFSTESIQEFQISTFNFDLSTGVTSVGAVNIITRTGTNAYHGNGFIFFRDKSFAALPTFFRPAGVFDPDFRRYQSGGSFGGPIKKDRAFFFANFEKLNQTSAISTFITGAPALAAFNTSFTSPYTGYLFNVRGDIKISDKNNMFARFSRDKNDAFSPNGSSSGLMPSIWRANRNRDNNIQAGLTTVFTQNLVNDVRFNYQRINNTSDIPSDSDCPPSNPACIGLRGPQISINNSNFLIGNETNAPQNRLLDRYQTRDDMNWQKGSHRIRYGAEWEHNYGVGSWDFFDPALIVLHDPRDVEATNVGLIAATAAVPEPFRTAIRTNLFIPVPASLATGSTTRPTLADILQLPFIAGVAGIGDKVQPPSFHTDIARQGNRYRFYGQDSWLAKPGFTFSFGASYQYETNLGNHDLNHPALLAALIGDLGKSKKDKNNIAPSAGFAWDVKNNGKTVVRGGAGIYYDTILFVTRLLERPLLGPAGDGRLSIPTAFFKNTIAFPRLAPLPGALAAFNAYSNAINPAVGQGLDIQRNLIGLSAIPSTLPSKLTAQNFLDMLAVQGPATQALLNAGAAAGFDSLQFIKASQLPGTLLDPNLEVPYSEQFTIGVQHQLPHNMAISVDFVERNRFHNTQGLAAAIDYNHFNRSAARGGPVLPKCTAAQAVDPNAICANGPIFIINSVDRNHYKALLVKVDKRFSNRYQFTASYALSNLTGFFTKGGTPEDADKWFGSSGPLSSDAKHRFTFSGVVSLPVGIQASLITVLSSRAPFNARVGGTVDLNGDGQGGDTLPDLKVNDLGRGTSKADLFKLVGLYNQNVVKPTCNATFTTCTLNPVVLPPTFEFGDIFQSEDVRVSKVFKFKERYSIEAIAEVFNIFNIANLTGYSSTLDSSKFDTAGNVLPKASYAFGQPSQRLGLGGFGTGAPRALQLAARFSF
ncbi:MAG TPA: carboxypeptidase regulatory-like domain-containing protein [Blastocatellia bacterium]|nr:carboxypeptidase regulatory-like domain-containing protein [Blastocatellia bacterium]